MRALLSVYDQRGIVDLATGLQELGCEVVSTGGTAAALIEAGVRVTAVSDITKFPEILAGRVKTLHPAVYGGILARRADEDDLTVLREHGIELIDLVAVNFRPFPPATSSREESAPMLEDVDVGGPALLRAAAKNHRDVAVLADPDDYEDVLAELLRYGAVREKTRARLAAKAFALTSAYDAYIAAWMAKQAGEDFPARFSLPLTKIQDLRYGENLHQRASLYADAPQSEADRRPHTVVGARQIHGKELSFNNYLDLDAAWTMVNDFAAPAVAIVKHTNPTGLAAGRDVLDAYNKAYNADPVSAYGGLVGFNRTVDEPTAAAMVGVYFEAVIAPGFSEEAVRVLGRKKAIRLLDVGSASRTDEGAATQMLPYQRLDYKRINGGFLAQTRNVVGDPQGNMQVVTQREPTLEELTDLLFAWRAVKHVKSNGIVIARKLALVGVGAGQMSRVNAVDLACRMAEERAQGSVLASDAYFPFADGVERAAEAGVTAIIQPGGSIRDRESIDVANKAGMAMIFTGLRHFKH
ncbi:MAG TPA: bifunctional phosphoribosylaminoimidazolecarboxamide formyltransferase/IMP cyclohydrolase [Chloroflexota bacterium]|nr:bifunctional phosphoribosylaminoimidazolecarboxamide formyltransferase/IMP cyclohydrolase [Chloroflexota bacterium]